MHHHKSRLGQPKWQTRKHTGQLLHDYQEAVPIEDLLEPWIQRFVDLELIPWDGPGSDDGDILSADLHLEEDRNHVSWRS